MTKPMTNPANAASGKPNADVITKTVFFDAPRETVWAFLTEKDKIMSWFHAAEDDLAAGQDYLLYDAGDDGEKVERCRGTVTEMDPPERMVWTFTVKPLKGAMTTVTWRLEEAHGGTRLTLVHEGVGQAAGAGALGLLGALDKGWDAHFGRLRERVSG